jgi:hypothetical protein
VLLFLALGMGICVTQLFVLFPWRALFAAGAALVALAAGALYDRNGIENELRAYGIGFFDGRRHAFAELRDRLDRGAPQNAGVIAFLEHETDSEATTAANRSDAAS